MARIAGVDLPRNKRVVIALTYIYGIGLTRSQQILEETGIDDSIRIRDLNDDQVAAIRTAVGNFTVEGDLRREVQGNIKRLKDINSYRGLRHKNNLPARGQRTKTNARSRRGSKKTVAGRGRRRGAVKK